MRVFVTGAETLTPLSGNFDANSCRFLSVYTFLLWDLQNALGVGGIDALAWDPNSDLAMLFSGTMRDGSSVIPDPPPAEIAQVATADAISVWGAEWIYNLSEGIAPKPALLADIAALYTQAIDANLGWIDAGSGTCVCPAFSFLIRSHPRPANIDFVVRCSVVGYDFLPIVEWSRDGGATWQLLPEGSEQTMEVITFTCPGASENFTLSIRDSESPLVVSETKQILIIPG